MKTFNVLKIDDIIWYFEMRDLPILKSFRIKNIYATKYHIVFCVDDKKIFIPNVDNNKSISFKWNQIVSTDESYLKEHAISKVYYKLCKLEKHPEDKDKERNLDLFLINL